MSTGIWKLSMFLIIFGLLLTAAGLIWRYCIRSREILKGHTVARVVKLLSREDTTGTAGAYSRKYYPVFEYYADSKRYSEVYPFGSYPSRFRTGQQMQIDYDKNNPKDYEIHVRTYRDILPAALYFGGTGMIALGAVLFIIFAAR